VFVPAVFLLVDSLERTLGRWLGRLVGARDEAPDGAVSHGA
jgi:hypothetical protein